jgi:hypothetical protein
VLIVLVLIHSLKGKGAAQLTHDLVCFSVDFRVGVRLSGAGLATKRGEPGASYSEICYANHLFFDIGSSGEICSLWI